MSIVFAVRESTSEDDPGHRECLGVSFCHGDVAKRPQRGGLENRLSLTGHVGSNPTVSVNFEIIPQSEVSMRSPLRKRKQTEERLLLAAPAMQLSADQIRDSIAALIDTAKPLLREPEAKDTDIEEDICWMFLLFPALENALEQGQTHEASWWYNTMGAEIQSDKQMAILASALNMAAFAS